MASNFLQDLAVRFIADTSEWGKTLDIARKDIQKFSSSTKEASSQVGEGFALAKESITSFGMEGSEQIASFTEGAKVAGNIIKSSFTAVKDSASIAKASLKEFATSIKNINVSDVFSNMKQSIIGVGESFKGGGFTDLLKGGLTKAIGAVSTAWKAFSVVFISTGIGALITAIVLAVVALVTWISKSEAGSSKLKEVWNQVVGVVKAVLDTMFKIGGAIVKMLSGEFKQGWKDMKDAVAGTADKMRENVALAKELSALQKKMREDDIGETTRAAELERDIAKYRAILRDESAPLKERTAALQQVKKAEEELYEIKKGDAEDEIKVLEIKQKMSGELAKNVASQQEMADKKAGLIKMEQEHWEMVRSYYKDAKLITKELQEQRDIQEEINGIKKDKKQIKNDIQSGALAPLQAIDPKPVSMTMKTAQKVAKEVAAQTNAELAQIGAEIPLTKLQTFAYAVIDLTTQMGQSFGDLGSRISKAFGTIATTLSKGAKTFKEFGKNILSSIKETISGYIAESVASMILGQVKFFARMGPVGIALMPIAAAAAAGVVKTAFNSLLPKFANSGILPGSYGSGDRQMYYGNAGEMVLSQNDQVRLLSSIKMGGIGGSVDKSPVRFELLNFDDILYGSIDRTELMQKVFGARR